MSDIVGGGTGTPERAGNCVSAATQPSRETELPDFDEFLASIGYGHFYRLRSEKERRVEVAMPMGGHRPGRTAAPAKGSKWHAKDWIFALVPIVATLAVVSFPAVWHVLSQGAASAAAKEASDKVLASPCFSLESFRTIRPGMTVAELRDLCGLPLSRLDSENESADSYWIYTALNGASDAMPLCSVWIAAGRVVRHQEVPLRTRMRDFPGMPAPVQRVGDLVLTLDGGAERVVRGSNRAPIVLLDRRCRLKLEDLALPTGSALRVESAVRESDKQNPPRTCGSIYWKGSLFLLPFEGHEIPQQSREDLEWLLAHLA